MNNVNVLMCGSDLSVGGGMVTVTRSYLNYKNWNNINIKYIPTHINSNAIFKLMYYFFAVLKIIILSFVEKYDIAHLHVMENGSFYRKAILLRILKKRKIKVILHHHIDYEEFYNRQSKSKQRFIDKTFAYADENIVLGNAFSEFILKKAKNAKVSVVYNAVESYKENMYNKKATDILFFGWLNQRKGIFEYLEAIKNLDEKLGKEVKFVFLGNGGQEVYKEISRLNIQHRIRHIGWVEKNKCVDYFSNVCMNVLPSHREGLPMTILETMAYGIPNVASNIAAIPEVIKNRQTGILISPGNVDEIVNAIMDLYLDETLRCKLSDASYNLVKNEFCIDKHIEKIRNLYISLLIKE